MTYSNCCGAVVHNTDYDICPECKEHCDFEDDEEEENKDITLQNPSENKAIPEISDEEIEIEAEQKFPNTTTISFDIKQVWIDGAKWYREQLKQK